MASSIISPSGSPSQILPLQSGASATARPRERWRPDQVGIISNPRSHRNLGSEARSIGYVARHASPKTLPALRDEILRFAASGLELLVIDGGDGTVRDVLTAGYGVWGGNPPKLLVLPSGKTNALANDLAVPRRLCVEQCLPFANRGRFETRTPIEIRGDHLGPKVLQGFVFGAGAFVEATALAQDTHRAGAFAGLAVGLTLAWSIGRTLIGRQGSPWAQGADMAVSYGVGARALHGDVPHGRQDGYLMLASTLDRMPLGLMPFGRRRRGLKTLLIDAPPQAVPTSVFRLLTGSEAPSLDARGYHRVDTDSVALDLPAGFILDGEYFPGGTYALARGAPMDFIVP